MARQNRATPFDDAPPAGSDLLARPYHAKQLAPQAAMEITERPILANEIRV
jgi:hypothetical protein